MNKSLFLTLLSLIFITACEKKTPDENNSAQDSISNLSSDSITNNKLTYEQTAAGWKLLFNGRSIEGWRMFKNKKSNSWDVVDGTLHSKPFDSAEMRADIMTSDQYENFELSFDWKLSPQGNSGVMFRVVEDYNEPYLSGPEYQVLDDEGYPGDKPKDSQLTGSNYDMHPAPIEKPVRAIGEWNTSKLVVVGKHVEHWLNGKKLIEYEIDSDDWKQRKQNSKWKDAKGYAASPKGHIVFQDHKNEMWYRNIMIKTL